MSSPKLLATKDITVGKTYNSDAYRPEDPDLLVFEEQCGASLQTAGTIIGDAWLYPGDIYPGPIEMMSEPKLGEYVNYERAASLGGDWLVTNPSGSIEALVTGPPWWCDFSGARFFRITGTVMDYRIK